MVPPTTHCLWMTFAHSNYHKLCARHCLHVSHQSTWWAGPGSTNQGAGRREGPTAAWGDESREQTKTGKAAAPVRSCAAVYWGWQIPLSYAARHTQRSHAPRKSTTSLHLPEGSCKPGGGGKHACLGKEEINKGRRGSVAILPHWKALNGRGGAKNRREPSVSCSRAPVGFQGAAPLELLTWAHYPILRDSLVAWSGRQGWCFLRRVFFSS